MPVSACKNWHSIKWLYGFVLQICFRLYEAVGNFDALHLAKRGTRGDVRGTFCISVEINSMDHSYDTLSTAATWKTELYFYRDLALEL